MGNEDLGAEPAFEEDDIPKKKQKTMTMSTATEPIAESEAITKPVSKKKKKIAKVGIEDESEISASTVTLESTNISTKMKKKRPAKMLKDDSNSIQDSKKAAVKPVLKSESEVVRVPKKKMAKLEHINTDEKPEQATTIDEALSSKPQKVPTKTTLKNLRRRKGKTASAATAESKTVDVQKAFNDLQYRKLLKLVDNIPTAIEMGDDSDVLPGVPMDTSQPLNNKQRKYMKRLIYLGTDGTFASISKVQMPVAPKKLATVVAEVTKIKDTPNIDEEFAELFKKMVDVSDPAKARSLTLETVGEDRIEEAMESWKILRRKKVRDERIAKIVEMEGTLQDVKDVVNELIRKQRMFRSDAALAVKKWKAREGRRLDRLLNKADTRTCFQCRQSGHVWADCPDKDSLEDAVTTTETGICFKCGSDAHAIYSCPKKHIKGLFHFKEQYTESESIRFIWIRKNPDPADHTRAYLPGFPFATCFVCHADGHLSRDCEKNQHGIYPDGGECSICGSKKHLKRECPELKTKDIEDNERVVEIRAMSSTDAVEEEVDVVTQAERQKKVQKRQEEKKKKKIINF